MKKTFALISALMLCAALFFGCAASQTVSTAGDGEAALSEDGEKTVVRLASLMGPTTMGLVGLLEKAGEDALSYEVESGVYGAADEITGLLTTGEIDMAAIPCNLAATLYAKTGGSLKVAAVNTLGVLYVVEMGESVSSVADLEGKTVYSTGMGTTPEYVFNAILSANGLDPAADLTIEFRSEAAEIAALLATEDSGGALAVLPQPYVTTVLNQNENARIALDLTSEWGSVSENSLVTGVLVVSSSFAEANPETVDAFLADYKDSADWVNANPVEAAVLIEGYGIVAKAAVAEAALPYCNIVCTTGGEMKADISSYLGVLYGYNPQSVGGALPDDAFYYGA
ncbi:MAG: ABC transporter substrate-binding protein [Oscillospiraceae bacterium]|nr:ABC transporter substrate-binding protein [Oscillospiraceae bacterium]